MSLKAMLSGKSETDREFQEILRAILPTKDDFKTISGKPAFSSYSSLAPYNLSRPSDARIVGMAFDYLARAMVAQKLENGKEASFLELAALNGLKKAEKQIDKKLYAVLSEKYISVLADFIDYIYSNNAHVSNCIDHCKSQEEYKGFSKFLERASSSNHTQTNDINLLIPGAYYFAKLEQVFRSGGILPDDFESAFLSEPSAEIENDLQLLCDNFKNHFVKPMISPNSTVVFNPKFGIGSILCRGADADIYVDGTLYDFKTGKSTGYKWQEVAQIVAYYFLNDIAVYGYEFDLSAPLLEYKIKRLAFYKARYGEIEYFNTEKFGQDIIKQTVEHIAKYFKNHPNFNLAILYFQLPPDASPEIFDKPYPFAEN